MKKILVLLLSVMLLLGATGCDQINELVDSALDANAGGTTGSTSSANTDKLYSDLSSLIGSPDGLERSYNDYLDKKITFTAMILSEPEEWDFDEEDGGTQTYMLAAISRNDNSEFLINVEAIPEASRPADGDIVSVTGKIDGTIYTIYDNEKSDFIDFVASDITPKEPTGEPDTANKIPVTSWNAEGDISFVSAELTQDVLSDAILIYFEFTNTGSEDAAPPIGKITFYQGDTLLTTSIHSVKAELNPSALSSSMVPEKTVKGKTFLYYAALKPSNSSLSITGDPLEAYQWDDDFNCTNMVIIPIGDAAGGDDATGEADPTEETDGTEEDAEATE
ncbi:MAG: hypothetical protein ACK5LX_06620 [Oscillospiraceae bacterium]